MTLSLIKEIDYGTPARRTRPSGDAGDRWQRGHACRRAPRSCAPPWRPASRCRSSAPPTASSLRLLPPLPGRDRGPPGTPASCTTPVEPGMKVTTQTPQLAKLRRGVMELYISDHPLDCLTCAANGDCELQDMAGAVGLREVRYGYDGANHLTAEKDESNPYFTFDPVEVHRLLALRARLRGSAGHLRADDRRPRLRLEGVRRPDEDFHRLRVRLLRRLRAGLPDRDADGEVRHRAGPAGAQRHHHLRLLRRRLLLQGRDAGQRGRAHGAVQGRQGEPRPFLRQGPLRLGLRDPQGPHHSSR